MKDEKKPVTPIDPTGFTGSGKKRPGQRTEVKGSMEAPAKFHQHRDTKKEKAK